MKMENCIKVVNVRGHCLFYFQTLIWTLKNLPFVQNYKHDQFLFLIAN